MHKENIKKIIIDKNKVEKEFKFIRPPKKTKEYTRFLQSVAKKVNSEK